MKGKKVMARTDARRQGDGFFFVKIGFFLIKSHNLSRKSIKLFFLEITKSILILDAFH
jgi:hypothetical protein